MPGHHRNAAEGSIHSMAHSYVHINSWLFVVTEMYTVQSLGWAKEELW